MSVSNSSNYYIENVSRDPNVHTSTSANASPSAQKIKSFARRNISLVGNKARVEMSVACLQRICRRKGLYDTCAINDVLYLNFEGFSEIQPCLQTNYFNLKSLFMESNSIHEILYLEKLTLLKGLYMQKNVLTRIENIGTLINLSQLDFSNNRITEIEMESLENLSNLDSLSLKNNCLSSLTEIAKIVNGKCGQNISCLDLSGNNISSEGIIDLLSSMPKLKLLYLKGNPFLQTMDFYRKTTVAKLRALTFLDDRPIFEQERRLNDAWMKGGPNEEHLERVRIKNEEKDKRLKTKQERKMKYELRKAAMLARVQREREEKESKEESDVSEDIFNVLSAVPVEENHRIDEIMDGMVSLDVGNAEIVFDDDAGNSPETNERVLLPGMVRESSTDIFDVD